MPHGDVWALVRFRKSHTCQAWNLAALQQLHLFSYGGSSISPGLGCLQVQDVVIGQATADEYCK